MSQKLGWSVHETIGIAIINPRALAGFKTIKKFLFKNEVGSIEIERYSIKLDGSMEGIARALAEEILKAKRENMEMCRFDYLDVIRVDWQNNRCTVDLTVNGLGLIYSENWTVIKNHTEKMVNNLKAFL